VDTNLTPQASRILDCAQALIATGGYNGFSYADISAQVGITKASIHHHFPKKADLVRTLVQRYREAGAEGMAALTANGTGPLDCLDAYVAWWAACIGDGTMPICICALLAAETPALPAEVAEEVRLHFAGLATWLERVMATGAASSAFQLQAAPAAEAQAFMATVHGAMLSARAYSDPKLFERIVRSALERLMAAR
jgi:TetR/AcrR family transcriptional regulator, transcriptional repressor for nem operon